MPVLEPATSKRSPTTVKNPMKTPPNMAAVGIISLRWPTVDCSWWLGRVRLRDLSIFA